MLGYDLWEMAMDSSALSLTDISRNEHYMGIVPRSMTWLFHRLDGSPDISYNISVSYIELYNDIKIIDLLDNAESTKVLDIRENKMGDIVVPGLVRVNVRTAEEVLQVLWKGAQCRSVAATDMNDHSSRSHTVFMVYVSIELLGGEKRRAKICLVDLAGSEKWKSHQMGTFSDSRIKELTSINRSLSALGNCISALLKPGRGHIPYRDSKLTRLLQDSLGGNTRTLFIVTLSPAMSSLEETTSTLQFADRAMRIQVTAAPNKTTTEGGGCNSADIQKYQKEILRLRSLLQLVLQRCGRDVDITDLAKVIECMGGSSFGANQPSLRKEECPMGHTKDKHNSEDLDLDACISQELVDLKEENMKVWRDLLACQAELRHVRNEKRQILAAVYQDDAFGLEVEYGPSGEVLSTQLMINESEGKTDGVCSVGCGMTPCNVHSDKCLNGGDGCSSDTTVGDRNISSLQARLLQIQREEISRRQEQIDEAGVYQEDRWTWLQQYHTWLQSQTTPVTRESLMGHGIGESVYQRVCLMEASILLQADELQKTKKFFLKVRGEGVMTWCGIM